MRLTTLSILLLSSSTVLASSWFSADDEPKQWTNEQLTKAQKVFEGVKDDAFETWSESKLREFLIDTGYIEPKGTREQLAKLARA
ncbi:hypothetical protein FRC16_002617, partial [Serendipita sp. 398]